MMQKTNNDPTLEDVKAFVSDNFEKVNELINVTLNDWRPNPYILDKIADPNYREWASALNYIWNTLARRMSDDVANHPSRHSLIYVNNTFIIPGGRFKGSKHVFPSLVGHLKCNGQFSGGRERGG